MALLAPAVAEVILLKYMLGQDTAATAGQQLHLYGNPYTPDDNSSLSNFSETSYLINSGYTQQILTPTGWTVTAAASLITAQYSEITFTFTTGLSSNTQAWGYFVTANSAGTSLLWAELFSGGPFTMPSGGGSIAITSRVTLE